MKTRLLSGTITLLVALGVLALQASAKPAATPAVHYYLALGDSLSVGYQPNVLGDGVETNQGYANDLYAVARKHIKNLRLVQLGCPGDTTTSLLTGKGNASAARAFHCDRTGGSQLAAAVGFLKSHHGRGEVPLVTIDIGANDVDSCVAGVSSGVSTVETCVLAGMTKLEKNLPKILAAVREAAPQGTVLAGMNLYDPLLVDELSTDTSLASLAPLSVELIQSINTTIAKADTTSHFRTADVAAAFKTYDATTIPTAGTPLAASGVSTVATNLAEICTLTWMCAAAPVGPNIHANKAGYATIATAFEAVLPKQF